MTDEFDSMAGNLQEIVLEGYPREVKYELLNPRNIGGRANPDS